MTTFPSISRSCPFTDRLSELMDGDFCRQCSKTVTDLTAMSDQEITAFKAASAGSDVCISYRRPAKVLLAAALAATFSLTPLGVAAEPDGPAPAGDAVTEGPSSEQAPSDGEAEIVGVMSRIDDVSCDPRRLPEPIELSECRSAPYDYRRDRYEDGD